MTTARDIITMAYRDTGALPLNGTLNALNANEGLVRLNQMLGTWRSKRSSVYHQVTLGITSTGATSYTIGPGEDFDVAVRPPKLESAFVRLLGSGLPVDYPLDIIVSMEQYNSIALKTLSSFPSYVFYDTGWPVGTLYFWPVPNPTIYSIHVGIMDTLAAFGTLDDIIDLPPEYEAALRMQLARQLAPLTGKTLSPDYISMAKQAYQALRKLNMQIPELGMPAGLRTQRTYNVLSDR